MPSHLDPSFSLTNIYVRLTISETIPASKLAFEGLPLKAKCKKSAKPISTSPFDYSKYILTALELFIRAALHICIVHFLSLPISQLGRKMFLTHIAQNIKGRDVL